MTGLALDWLDRIGHRSENSRSCLQAPPTNLARPVQLGGRLYVAGDHRDTATLDGALKSGRRAAEALLVSRFKKLCPVLLVADQPVRPL